jgi:hypothetical protein
LEKPRGTQCYLHCLPYDTAGHSSPGVRGVVPIKYRFNQIDRFRFAFSFHVIM